MAVGINALRAIGFAARVRDIDFRRTVMLGRHEISFTEDDFLFVNSRGRLPISYDESIGSGRFAETFFRKLGAQEVDSIDASNYEGASRIMDFNEPVEAALCGKYSVFVDFGSMGHIFNVTQVLENIAALLAYNGTVIIQSQANGYPGHGFYQFSPDLFYAAFSKANGFDNTIVFLIDLQDSRRWFLIPRPEGRQSRDPRISIPAFRGDHIYCISTKRQAVQRMHAQQPCYEMYAWQTEAHSHVGGFRRSIYSRFLNGISPFLHQHLYRFYNARKAKQRFVREVPQFDPDRIARDEFDKLRMSKGLAD